MADVRIITVPYDSGHRNWRMGKGPAHILEHGLRDVLLQRGCTVSSEDVQVEAVTENTSAFAICRILSERVKAVRESKAFPLLLTGNCGSALGTVSGLGTDKTGIIWFDAHGEFNTPDTTLSGFLDGMGVAAMTGRCWKALALTVPGFKPIPDKHIILVGARDFDHEERALMESSGIAYISSEQVKSVGVQPALAPHLERLRQEVEQVYIHLDLDVLDPTEGHANAWPTPEGLTIAQVKETIELVKRQFRIAAGGVASFDPASDADSRALNAALELLGAVV